MLNPGCFVCLWLDHVKSHCLLFHSHYYLNTQIFVDWTPIVDDQNNFLKVQSQSLRLKSQLKMVELWFSFHNHRLQWKIPELDEGFKLGNLHKMMDLPATHVWLPEGFLANLLTESHRYSAKYLMSSSFIHFPSISQSFFVPPKPVPKASPTDSCGSGRGAWAGGAEIWGTKRFFLRCFIPLEWGLCIGFKHQT